MRSLRLEPAVLAGAINAAVGAVLSLPLVHLDAQTKASIIASVAAISALLVRSVVTPTAK